MSDLPGMWEEADLSGGQTEAPQKPSGIVRVDSYKLVCQECFEEYEDWNGWTIFGDAGHAQESAVEGDWVVRPGLVLCSSCGHRKVCMDEDWKCVRRDGLTEADDGWLYCPEHLEQVVLTINRSESMCGACGRSCLPCEARHETPCGWDQHAGCGATYTHVTTNYFGTEEAARRMRPDLVWLDLSPNIPPRPDPDARP